MKLTLRLNLLLLYISGIRLALSAVRYGLHSHSAAIKARELRAARQHAQDAISFKHQWLFIIRRYQNA